MNPTGFSPTPQHVDHPGVSNPFMDDMDGEAFLTMLVAQLRNQDPMSPMEADEMAVQLAQFSQVEAMNDMRGKLVELGESQEALFLMAEGDFAAGHIGRYYLAETEVNKLELSDDGKARITFEVSEDVSSAVISIDNPDGDPIEIDLGPHGKGRHTVDIRLPEELEDGSELSLPQGQYAFSVHAPGAEVESFTRLRINGVRMTADGFDLVAGPERIPFHMNLPIVD